MVEAPLYYLANGRELSLLESTSSSAVGDNTARKASTDNSLLSLSLSLALLYYYYYYYESKDTVAQHHMLYERWVESSSGRLK